MQDDLFHVADLTLRGGPVMLVLLGTSVAATAIILYKGYQFRKSALRRYGWVDRALDQLRFGDLKRAGGIVDAERGPAVRLIEVAIERLADPRPDSDPVEDELERTIDRTVDRLEVGLPTLASIASLTPLLGLLGTVLGMISAFMDLEKSGSVVDASVLAGGIWAALLTTAFALTIAIPSTAAVHYFEGELNYTRRLLGEVRRRLVKIFAAERSDEAAERSASRPVYPSRRTNAA